MSLIWILLNPHFQSAQVVKKIQKDPPEEHSDSESPTIKPHFDSN